MQPNGSRGSQKSPNQFSSSQAPPACSALYEQQYLYGQPYVYSQNGHLHLQQCPTNEDFLATPHPIGRQRSGLGFTDQILPPRSSPVIADESISMLFPVEDGLRIHAAYPLCQDDSLYNVADSSHWLVSYQQPTALNCNLPPPIPSTGSTGQSNTRSYQLGSHRHSHGSELMVDRPRFSASQSVPFDSGVLPIVGIAIVDRSSSYACQDCPGSPSFTTAKDLRRHKNTTKAHRKRCTTRYQCSCGRFHTRKDHHRRHLGICKPNSGVYKCNCGKETEHVSEHDEHVWFCGRTRQHP